MSDTDKNGPDSPQGADSEQKAPGAVVISIEQARAELLGKPRSRATPREARRPKARAGEAPAPVTLAPGARSALIVADTPAARAHVDKKTVHPGEMPNEPHEKKKVRLKPSVDPRHAKTQKLPHRVPEPSPAGDLPPERRSKPPERRSSPPGGASPSAPPRSMLARPKPLPRASQGVPMFAIGVVLAALIGAVLVYMLRQKAPQALVPSLPSTSAPSVSTSPVATAVPTQAPAASAEPSSSTNSVSPSASATEPPATTHSAPVVTKSTPFVKPATSASAKPTATAAPTTKNILPFGKEEP